MIKLNNKIKNAVQMGCIFLLKNKELEVIFI